ncbi:YggS family pyridoxal phosphate-dependent enzyme [Pelagibacterales bacterium SAG-MED10]|nr:YggS family pyridoxal phosphate-dependent enzyme [Pelagibacterales bacterium SAG-MED10]
MHKTVQNLIAIENQLKSSLVDVDESNLPKIIAVSKTFKIDKISPLIEHGHLHFGENKVQEAIDKWTEIKTNNTSIQLHMIGKLQTNKVKFAVKLFDYIHSVDSEKLAKKIADEQLKVKRNIKIFIQVNIGDETQKSGININETNNLVVLCQKLNLNVVGFMCIPPADVDPAIYFKEMDKINKINNFKQLSMGMSSDYIKAAQHNSTYLRIGSNIFGQRY